MSALVHELSGQQVRFVLPVTLSRAARRSVLLRTGVEPSIEQTFVVPSLMEFPADDRGRLIDLWEKVNVHFREHENAPPEIPWQETIWDARNDGYLWLQRGSSDRWSRYLPGTEGDAIDVDAVFYATPRRTITALDKLRLDLDESRSEELDAMLAGAPLVDDLGDSTTLGASHVLDAYDRALELAEQLIALVDNGSRDETDLFLRSAYEINDDAIFLHPDTRADAPNRPAAVLKEASPKAYDRAKELLEQLDEVAATTVAEKIDGACFHWWGSICAGFTDERKVEMLVKMAVTNALSDLEGEGKKAASALRYGTCRTRWIAKHGSQRLKRAADRGYRHDGIYRDERLKVELPDFVGSLGRKPTIRELVNPSEAALELEARVLARAEGLGITDDQVRLVYAQPGQDSDWADGEYVQIEGYLGRHTGWQSVSGAKSDDDIPF